MFLKVIEYLEQNIQKQIDCKRPSSSKQINRVQNINIKTIKGKYIKTIKGKYKHIRGVLAFFASAKLCHIILSKLNEIRFIATFDFNEHLMIKQLLHVTLCSIAK